MRSRREPLAKNCLTIITPTPLKVADTVGTMCGCWEEEEGEGGD